MAIMKVTTLYNQATGTGRSGGFSETWYYDGTMDQANTAATTLLKPRMDLLGASCRVFAIRVQEVGGRSLTYPFDTPGLGNADQDIPQMALNCLVLSATGLNVKRFQLRGFRDSNVSQGDFVPAGQVIPSLTDYGRRLVNNNFRFRAKKLDNPKIGILSIAGNGDFETVAPIALVVGDYVELLNAKGPFGQSVSGKYFVKTVATAKTGTLANWGGTVVAQSGTMRKLEIIYPLIKAGSFTTLRITTRKVGRPFGLYLGRRTR